MPADASETPEVLDFRKRDARAHVPIALLTRPVFLVGFMGAGKTSVARKLARNVGVSAVDIDTYVERITGKRISALFDEVGEQGFRDIETQVLREFAHGEPRLVSCGGGIVLRDENRTILKEGGYTIYLQVTAAEAASRISNLASRPLLGNPEQAQRIIEDRLPLYEEVADLTIDTTGRGSGSVARELARLLRKEGILTAQASAETGTDQA